MKKIFILSPMLITLLCILGCTKNEKADMIFKNGFIYTVNEAQPEAEAMAIKDGKILFVGSNKDVESYIGDSTVVEDLSGKLLLPGFIDAHAHYIIGATMSTSVVLDAHGTPEEWLDTIKEFAEANPDLPGILGLGIMPLKFGENGPTKELLDKAVPNRPAIIIDEGGHTAWVNSKTYEMAGITKDTPDPVPGVHMYKRKANNEPSGWNLEAMTIYPLIRDLKLLSTNSVKKGAEQYLPLLSSIGLTTYYDAGMMQMENVLYPVLKELEEEDKLPVKIVSSYMVQSPQQIPIAINRLKELQQKYQSEFIRPNTIKIHNDGTLEANTAALWEAYCDNSDNKGAILLEGDTLKNFVAEIAKNNFNVHIHAIGDKTVSEALDAIEYARKQVPNTNSRFTIAHTILVQDKDIARFGELNAIVQTTPVWIEAEDEVNQSIGVERSNRRYLIKSMEDAGAMITFGSDFPVGGNYGMYPLYNIEVGMSRQGFDKDSKVLPPAREKLSLESMIKGYTINAAYQLGMEKEIGSLEVGKSADLIVLDKNLFEIKVEDIHTAKVIMTILNGKITYKE